MGYRKIAVKGLLMIGKQSLQQWRARCLDDPLQATPQILTHPTPCIQSRPTSQIECQTLSNRCIGALAEAPDYPNDSQDAVTSFDFTQVSATQQLNFLDLDLQTLYGSQAVAGWPTLDNTLTPTTVRQLALSLEDLEPPEETILPWDMEQGESASIQVGS